MAQGTGSKITKPNPGLNRSKGGKAPKKSGVSKVKKNKTKADKVQKKFTAGMVAKTEKMLGARAGHLELIGKGKKEENKEKFKGGTRKVWHGNVGYLAATRGDEGRNVRVDMEA
ncbi:hypothetical protein B0T20DRAFT_475268 [Sordaria brevicollis]|uniref:Uncharacterized protein n=1 Tax=Sordaria brevicollis TaxID=83679 RepID=A0AAE0UH57_SORBR|nr:hypothetical protein B0T20DRAFT_475268 [Sordaria brevicollis]